MKHLPNSAWTFFYRLIRRVTSWDGFWWIAGIAIVLVIGGVLSCYFWEDLRGNQDSLSQTVRNVALVIGGVVAMLLAVWRSRVTERQASTTQQGLLNERYQKATDMLGSSILAVRLGGIYALQGLAEQNPEQYHVPVMKILCAFVRHPTEVEGQPTFRPGEIELGSVYGASTAQDFAAAGTLEIEEVREDIKAAMDSIAWCHALNRQTETLHNYWIDLHGADLRGVDLSNKDLSKAREYDEAAPFNYTMIGSLHSNLRGVKLHYANLIRTNLTQTDLSHASGLTQSILDNAYADLKMPPRLDNTFDFYTGEQLVWRGCTGS